MSTAELNEIFINFTRKTLQSSQKIGRESLSRFYSPTEKMLVEQTTPRASMALTSTVPNSCRIFLKYVCRIALGGNHILCL